MHRRFQSGLATGVRSGRATAQPLGLKAGFCDGHE
jgi:hypothetical protein